MLVANRPNQQMGPIPYDNTLPTAKVSIVCKIILYDLINNQRAVYEFAISIRHMSESISVPKLVTI